MDELIKQIEERLKKCSFASEAENLASAIERLERIRLMRRIVENGIEIEGHMGGRTQIRIVAPE